MRLSSVGKMKRINETGTLRDVTEVRRQCTYFFEQNRQITLINIAHNEIVQVVLLKLLLLLLQLLEERALYTPRILEINRERIDSLNR